MKKNRKALICLLSAFFMLGGSDDSCLRRESGLGRIDGCDRRCTAVCMRRGNDTAAERMDAAGNEPRQCGSVYDHRSATKITNLGALKIVLGIKRFIAYILFVMAFALATGLIVDLI